MGRVIVLNGTSSAGKTSLGRALQDTLPGVWHLLGLDEFLGTCPSRWFEDGTIDFTGGHVRFSETWYGAYHRWRGAIRHLVDGGCDVIYDEVTLAGRDDQQAWQEALGDVPVAWVRVGCPVEVAAQRERARGDRTIGMAADQHQRVHAGVVYDLETDTSAGAPADLAAVLSPQLVALLG